MRKSIILLIITISLLSIYFLTKGFAESAYIIKKDTYGAYTKEGIKKLLNVILTKDAEALPKLIIEGQIFSVKDGTKVFIEEQLYWEGIVRVRLSGQAMSIWLLAIDLYSEEDYNNDKSSQKKLNNKIDSKNNSTYRIEGILYDKINPVVIIEGKTYFLNDSIDGIQIIEISSDIIKVRQEEKIREYKVGDIIEDSLAVSRQIK